MGKLLIIALLLVAACHPQTATSPHPSLDASHVKQSDASAGATALPPFVLEAEDIQVSIDLPREGTCIAYSPTLGPTCDLPSALSAEDFRLQGGLLALVSKSGSGGLLFNAGIDTESRQITDVARFAHGVIKSTQAGLGFRLALDSAHSTRLSDGRVAYKLVFHGELKAEASAKQRALSHWVMLTLPGRRGLYTLSWQTNQERAAEANASADHTLASLRRPPSADADACKMGDVKACSAQCEAANATSCTVLGSLYLNGKGVLPDDVRGIALLKKGCDAGNTEGCVLLGVIYQNGSHGVTANNPSAAAVYERACELHDPRGCNNAGVLYEKGEGRPADDRRALSLYRQACDAGHALACRNVGRFVRDGRSTPKDSVGAGKFFQEAARLSRELCAAGNAEGCSNLGFMYRDGTQGLERDEVRAQEYLQRACNMGYAAVCARVHSAK